MTSILPIAPRPIAPPNNPSGCWDDRPALPKPVEFPMGRNCWVPRDRNGVPIQLPAPDATIQATEATTLLR